MRNIFEEMLEKYKGKFSIKEFTDEEAQQITDEINNGMKEFRREFIRKQFESEKRASEILLR